MEYLVKQALLGFEFANLWAEANDETIGGEKWIQCALLTDLEIEKAIATGAIQPVETTMGYVVSSTDPDASIKLSEIVAYGSQRNLWWLRDEKALARALGFKLDESMSEPAVKAREEESAQPVQRSFAQDAAVLAAISQAGYDPQALPKPVNGRPGVKAEIRIALKGSFLFVGSKIFDKAWERLLAGMRIVYDR